MFATDRSLKIAMLAPPWLPVPPPGYGGIESVLAVLCDGLVRRGHDVTLFAAPGSHSTARVQEVLPNCYPLRIERALHEADHVARVFAAIECAPATGGRPFDVIHDHCGFTALAMADRIQVPLVHTLHGPFDPDTSDFYRQHATKGHLVAISRAQQYSAPFGLRVTAIVPNPIEARDWPYEPSKGDYLLWVGRMIDTKGPHRAIAAAKAAGVPLVLAGPVQPGQESYFEQCVKPHIDGSQVRYVGEIGGEPKRRLFAEARALLMPIRWQEPFGMVIVEALTCGTPVISFAEGAAPEIVQDGVTGFLVADETEMADAVGRLDAIDPADCRADVIARFDSDRVAAGYETVYERVVALTSLRREPQRPAPFRPSRRSGGVGMVAVRGG
jgi:glycosyltransferase involved in cell wall biosynthesis